MNNNLINLLSKFSKDEWESLGDFISSPYFVKGRDYSALYSILRNHFLKNKSGMDLDSVILNSAVGKSMSPVVLKSRLAEFNKLAEKFLVQKNLEQLPVTSYAMLFEELIKRDLYGNFRTNYNIVKNKIKPVDASEFIPYSRILQSLGFYHRNNNDIKAAFDKFDEHVDCIVAYALDRLIYFATEYHFSDVFDIKYNADVFLKMFNSMDLPKVIEKIESSGSEYYTSVRLRYYIYNSFMNLEKPSLIDKAEKYFEKIKDNVSIDLKIDYFQKMQSYLVFHINKGDFTYLRKLFTLLNERLEDKDTINFSLADYPATEFRDFVVIGLKVKEYNWVEDFINKYSNDLHPSLRDEEKSIALVKLYTEKKEYIKALNVLNRQKNTKNHFHNIDIYKYKLMIYYDMKYFDELELTADSMNHYILKEGLIEIHKKRARDFILNISRLVKISKSPDRQGLVEFIDSLNSNKDYISEKKWLLEKANDLYS